MCCTFHGEALLTQLVSITLILVIKILAWSRPFILSGKKLLTPFIPPKNNSPSADFAQLLVLNSSLCKSSDTYKLRILPLVYMHEMPLFVPHHRLPLSSLITL